MGSWGSDNLSGFMAKWTLAVGLGVILAASPQQAMAQQGKDGMDPEVELFKSDRSESRSRLMQWLRDGRLDPNMVLDSNRATFMHYASTNYLDILSTAIDNGGKCNLKDASGATPLHFSAAQQPLGPGPDAIRLLVKCGADPNLRDRRGATPLHALYISVRKLGLIRNLIPASGGTLAELQAGGKRQDVLHALLAAGADPDIKDNDGNTPLMLLIKDKGVVFTVMGHLRLLLKHGANPNTRDKGGTTPLIVAVGSDSNSTHDDGEVVLIITALLRGGADPNLRDGRGDTPLIHAAKHEDDIVSETKALLAGGADPCLADRNGKLPIEHAGEDSPIGRLLYKAGGYRDKATGACVGAALAAEKKLGLDRRKVVRIQQCLKRQGFDPGAPDGLLGPRSRAAIRGWQKKEARTATGYLTRSDADALLAACAVAVSPVCPGETGKGCWMEVSGRAGCYLWNPNPLPEETVAWSGSCVDGKASGKGKTDWRYRKDGQWKTSSSEGELREGKFSDGHWIHRFPDGDVMEGPVVDGKQHGLWIKHGSSEFFCVRRGEQVDDFHCVQTTDRKMRTTRRAKLRAGPGASYSEVGTLEAEEKVRATGEAGEWSRVERTEGRGGFVRSSVLEKAPGFEDGQVFRDCAECPEMVVIPAGKFVMGSPGYEAGRRGNEGPQHEVTISWSFAVGKYEVTFAEWDACVAGGGCRGEQPQDWGEGRGRKPVVSGIWGGAKAYVSWLSGKTGEEYRLLSEAEWEYAARAGTKTRYSWGDEIGRNRASCRGCGGPGGKVPVGSFEANGFGLHDMHGNVWEWVEDCFHEDYTGAPTDGRAWTTGGYREGGYCGCRVIRGGGWDTEPEGLRSAFRGCFAPWERYYSVGFRVARTLAP